MYTMEIRAIQNLGPGERREIFERTAGLADARADAQEIVDDVRTEGDVALRRFASEFDDVEVGNLDVTDRAERAVDSLDADVREAIEQAAANIRAFHERQRPADWRERPDDWPPTRYEEKAVQQGRRPIYLRYVRRPRNRAGG